MVLIKARSFQSYMLWVINFAFVGGHVYIIFAVTSCSAYLLVALADLRLI